MKKVIFILVMSFTLARAQTNVYHEFPDSAACWQEIGFWGTYCGVYEYRYFYLDGDTIFPNGNIYQKLSQSGYYYCNGPPTYTGGTFFIREDVPQKKVYYVSPYNNTEQLLYDFTLSVGDTLFTYIFDYMIKSIDSVDVNGQYRKRWKTNKQLAASGGDTICFIEGIGSTSGPMHAIFGDQGIENGTHLSTFYTNGQCEFQEQYSPPCACNSTQVNEVKKSKFTVSPNPATESILIKSDKVLGFIEIKDLQGRRIFSSYCKTSNETINISMLENGIYFIQSTTGTFKFIIQ